jgi:hypothetical protein
MEMWFVSGSYIGEYNAPQSVISQALRRRFAAISPRHCSIRLVERICNCLNKSSGSK